jgi:hypothetical protein
MNTHGGILFICVKNYIACVELWEDEDSEMIVVEVVKGRDILFMCVDLRGCRFLHNTGTHLPHYMVSHPGS